MESAGSALVVAAKLVAPSPRPETLVRERVLRLLDEAVERPLTVVCAPAGYGKTTAVATWLDTLDCRHAWVSLDALDNDPRRLCAHVLAAIDGALPETMQRAREALDAGSDLLETVTALAANAVAEHAAARERLVVVLDDYEHVEHPDCHTLLMTLIDALPDTVRLVVCSRTPPPLRLARRRALSRVSELGPRELAFQEGEAERLLNQSLRLGLGPVAVAVIESRVEGWPAGLALMASSLAEQPDRTRYLWQLAERPPAVTGTNVAAYLVEEVLEGTDPRLREFLSRTSILGRLNGPLCAAVLEDAAAHDLLAEVRRSNLFVTVLCSDAHGEWLRYHPLFAELLEQELRATSPDLVPVLHRRACTWLAANDLPEDAIHHAIAAGDGERAAELLRDSWRALLNERRYETLRRLIARIPPERGKYAGLCEAVDALCMGLQGVDLRLVAQRLDALEPHRKSPDVSEIIDYARVSPGYGDIRRAIADGWAAWRRCSDMRLRAELAAKLGIVLWFAGDHDGVRELVEPHLNAIERPTARSWALATLALTAADQDDADLAERYAREAVEVGEPHGAGDALEFHNARVALGEALRLRGALEEAGRHIAHAARLTSKAPGSVFQAFTLVFEAQLALTRRDRIRARARAAAARDIIDRFPDVGTLADRLATIEAALQHRSDDDLRGTEPTPAELRVLELLPSNLTLEQIAQQLYLSVHTVRAHRRRLYRRLGAASRQHAITIARARGLLSEQR